jgi:hypothetical protein
MRDLRLKYLWPICAQCNKPVDRFEYEHCFFSQTEMFYAECHGESERGDIKEYDLMKINISDIKESRAFVNKKLTSLPSSLNSPSGNQ